MVRAVPCLAATIFLACGSRVRVPSASFSVRTPTQALSALSGTPSTLLGAQATHFRSRVAGFSGRQKPQYNARERFDAMPAVSLRRSGDLKETEAKLKNALRSSSHDAFQALNPKHLDHSEIPENEKEYTYVEPGQAALTANSLTDANPIVTATSLLVVWSRFLFLLIGIAMIFGSPLVFVRLVMAHMSSPRNEAGAAANEIQGMTVSASSKKQMRHAVVLGTRNVSVPTPKVSQLLSTVVSNASWGLRSAALFPNRLRYATIHRSSGWLDFLGVGNKQNDVMKDAERPGYLRKKDAKQTMEQHQSRFWSYADGKGDEARLKLDGLRSVLECTDEFCLTKNWLPDHFVDTIYDQYAREPADGIMLKDFDRLAHDGMLLTGKLDEYYQAFSVMDASGAGVITRDDLGRLFAGLGRLMAPEELDAIVDEADVGHDGIDFADFLRLATTHLDLDELLVYFQTHPKPEPDLPVDLASEEFDPRYHLGQVTTVHGEAELNGIVRNGADTVVKLTFSWCRPCKGFWPKYKNFAKIYGDTRFVKIVGNENRSCKHYAQTVIRAQVSPVFAVYSKGKLLKTWHGANVRRFVENMEKYLETALAKASDREAAGVSRSGA